MEEIKTVSLKHVCAVYGVNVTQVRYAIKKGLLVAKKKPGAWEWEFPVDKLPSEWPVRERKRKEG